jgi:hypothetical protein
VLRYRALSKRFEMCACPSSFAGADSLPPYALAILRDLSQCRFIAGLEGMR